MILLSLTLEMETKKMVVNKIEFSMKFYQASDIFRYIKLLVNKCINYSKGLIRLKPLILR